MGVKIIEEIFYYDKLDRFLVKITIYRFNRYLDFFFRELENEKKFLEEKFVKENSDSIVDKIKFRFDFNMIDISFTQTFLGSLTSTIISFLEELVFQKCKEIKKNFSFYKNDKRSHIVQCLEFLKDREVIDSKEENTNYFSCVIRVRNSFVHNNSVLKYGNDEKVKEIKERTNIDIDSKKNIRFNEAFVKLLLDKIEKLANELFKDEKAH